MKKRISLLFLFLFLTSCFATTGGDVNLSPAQVLEMQEREENIIKEQLSGRKLDNIEGIWLNQGKQSEAIYKRGDIYLRIRLRDGSLRSQINKIGENQYDGDCEMYSSFEIIKGDLELVSTDNNTLALSCTRKDYITKWEKMDTEIDNVTRCWWCRKKEAMPEDIRQTATFKRVWPEDYKKHNEQF